MNIDHLSTGGWIFMLAAWTFIIALNVYCFINIFKERKEDIVDPMPEVDAQDK